MGFWQGMNEGLTYVLDKKAAEASEEKQYAFIREEYQRKLIDGRRDKLLELRIARGGDSKEANEVTNQAKAFFARLGEDVLTDPRAQALLKSPTLAAQLQEQVSAIEVSRAKEGLDAPPLQGQNLLDLLTIYDTETDTVAPAALSVDEILALDVSNPATYEEAVLGLTNTQGDSAYATINPNAYLMVDPKKLEEGRKLFDEFVLQEAQTALLNIGEEDTAAKSDLLGLIEGYKVADSTERMKLQDQFGYSAYKKLRETNNPYIQDFKSDPKFDRFRLKYAEDQARAILADPEASQNDIDGANAWLKSQGLM